MPKDEAWIWHPDEQREKEARAKEMADTRLCVFCKRGEVVVEQQRESGADMRGRYVTYEPSRS